MKGRVVMGIVGVLSLPGVLFAQAEIPPTPTEVAQAFTDEWYPVLPIVFGIIATVAVIFWTAQRIIGVFSRRGRV